MAGALPATAGVAAGGGSAPGRRCARGRRRLAGRRRDLRGDTGRRRLAGDDRAQRLGEPLGLRVLEVDDVDVAAGGGREIHALGEVADALRERRVLRADEQAVRAPVDGQGDARRRARPRRLRGFGQEPLHRLPDIDRSGVAQLDRGELRRLRLVDGGDHLAQALQVRRVVGDHDAVRRRERVDHVVGRDERPQRLHDRLRRLVRELEHLGHHLVAARAPGVARPGVELRVRLGDDVHVAEVAAHRREPLHAQAGEQDREHHVPRHRPRRDDVHRALDARIDQEVAAGHLRHRLHHRVDVGVDEVERHRVVGRRRNLRADVDGYARERERRGGRERGKRPDFESHLFPQVLVQRVALVLLIAARSPRSARSSRRAALPP